MPYNDLRPVAGTERLVLVDALRGFALLGILLVNIGLFSHPFQTLLLPLNSAQPRYDLAAAAAVLVLAEGKFYALFSMLFGLGLAMQMQRAQARGSGWRVRYVRRLVVLLAIGVLHGALVWAGDILALYAVVGFGLMLFAGCPPGTLMRWLVAIGISYVLAVTAAFGALHLALQMPEAGAAWQYDAAGDYTRLREALAESYSIYATGSFAEIAAQRIRDLVFWMSQTPFYAPIVLLYFLLGLHLGKRGVFQQPEQYVYLFRRWLTLGVLLGLPLAATYAATRFISDPLTPGWIDWWAFIAFLGGGLALSLGYAGALSLLWLRLRGRNILALLAPVGRMALTNYLLQSVVCTLIFYSYGLGLFGQVSPAGGLAIALGVYALQIPFSHWWLKRFRFGPMEWVWRTLTYGRWQPMRA